jgi:hypothetical protein
MLSSFAISAFLALIKRAKEAKPFAAGFFPGDGDGSS